jgi:hypothetical protein
LARLDIVRELPKFGALGASDHVLCRHDGALMVDDHLVDELQIKRFIFVKGAHCLGAGLAIVVLCTLLAILLLTLA